MEKRGYYQKAIEWIAKRSQYCQQLEQEQSADRKSISRLQTLLAEATEDLTAERRTSNELKGKNQQLIQQMTQAQNFVLRGIIARADANSKHPYLIRQGDRVVYVSDRIKKRPKVREVVGESYMNLQVTSDHLDPDDSRRNRYINVYGYACVIGQEAAAPLDYKLVHLNLDRKVTTKLKRAEKELRKSKLRLAPISIR